MLNTIVAGASALVLAAKTVSELEKGAEAVGKIGSKIGGGISKIGSEIDNFDRDVNSLSLTRYTKQTTLRSRVYIDESIAQDEVVPKLIRALHTMYAGLIINALQLSQFVTQGKTVQDFIGTVASESLEAYRDVRADFSELTVGLEVNGMNVPTAADMVREKSTEYTSDEIDAAAKKIREDHLKKIGEPDAPKHPGDFKASDVKMAPPDIAPVGTLIEVTMTNPENPQSSAKLTLAVQMVPYLIPARLASMFINKDTSLSFTQRLIQWKVGEIAFWRDVIFQIDRTNREYQIIKDDPNKVFYEFMKATAKKDRATVTKNLSQPNASKSHNIANTVMIFSADTVTRAKAESGIDLHNASARARYFRDTYAMVIAVVDNMYNHVTIYLNGIDDVGVYSFSDFSGSTGGKDGGLDLLKTLAQFTANKSPRF